MHCSLCLKIKQVCWWGPTLLIDLHVPHLLHCAENSFVLYDLYFWKTFFATLSGGQTTKLPQLVTVTLVYSHLYTVITHNRN